MKYRILALVIILMSLMSLTVSAADYQYSISPDDSFIAVERGDDLTQISQKLKMTADELSNYFQQNDIIYFAISESTKSQIKISVYSDDFSAKVSDISLLDDKALEEFAKTFDTNSDSIIVNNNRQFVCLKNTHEYSGGRYTTTQYITICRNRIFYFTGYNDGADTSDEISSAFKTFKLGESKTNFKSNNTDSINLSLSFVILGIVVFSIISVVMIISIIKLKISKEAEDREP